MPWWSRTRPHLKLTARRLHSRCECSLFIFTHEARLCRGLPSDAVCVRTATGLFDLKRLVILLLCATAVFLTGPVHAESRGTEPWRVVILMGSDPALPAMQQHDQALRAALQAASPRGVAFFTDTIDAYRFDYRTFGPEFLALQRKKYARQPVDLVIGVGDLTIDPIMDLRAALWPETPVVFGALDSNASALQRIPTGLLAATWALDIDGTLSMIERVQPLARRLVVVGGSAAFDQAMTQRVAERAKARGTWPIETWDDLSIDQLRERLTRLDRTVAVYYTALSRDAAGRGFFPADALAQFAATSAAPIYGMYSTYIDRGAVAGRVVDFEDAGRQTAAGAISLLKGQPAVSVGERMGVASTRCVANYKRLDAYGLSTDNLPAACELRNAPSTLWSAYRNFVLAAGGVVALQAITITSLLVQRRRRLQAQADAEQRRLELARAMRFAAMGELTASIAHEINQPLGAILSNADAAELMLRGGRASPEALRDILADIRRDDLRAHEVIRRLRGLLEKREIEHSPLGLHAALREALSLIEPEARARGISLEVHLDAADDQLVGDAIQLQQVLLNLAMNAMDAMDHTPASQRRLRVMTTETAQHIELSVIDSGAGIQPADLDRVFDSFFTTKPDGMGLGLPIVRAIVEAHQGSITAHVRSEGGTLMQVQLPKRRRAQPVAPPIPTELSAGSST